MQDGTERDGAGRAGGEGESIRHAGGRCRRRRAGGREECEGEEWQRQRVRAAAARGRPKGVRVEGGGDGGAARVG